MWVAPGTNTVPALCLVTMCAVAFAWGVQWRAHELARGIDIEVWITAMDTWHRDVLVSGGDDARMHGWDLRCVPWGVHAPPTLACLVTM